MGTNSFVGKAGTASGATSELLVTQTVEFATRYSTLACFIATPRNNGPSTFVLRVAPPNTTAFASTTLTCTIPANSTTGVGTVPSPGVAIGGGSLVDILVTSLPGPASSGSFALGP
jgi:hypothetical protein